MHKQLYLIRHAQAVEKNSNQTDKDRELTQTGIQEAIQIGTMLSDQNFLPEIIYASSAERTIQTAMIVANTLKFDRENVHYDDALYEASTRTFFQFIAALDDNLHKVCCVGHNPVISYLAEYLSKAEIGDMATGSCAVIKFDFSRWMEVSQRAGELVTYLRPATSKNE
jgi:phosphohistidine phosphatase